MEDIKIGDYARTKIGRIIKVMTMNNVKFTEFSKKQYCKSNNIQDCNEKTRIVINGSYCLADIINHSQNISDILKPGDIAVMICYGQKVQKFLDRNDIIEIKLGNYKLLKIMCKEMFTKKCYEVE